MAEAEFIWYKNTATVKKNLKLHHTVALENILLFEKSISREYITWM